MSLHGSPSPRASIPKKKRWHFVPRNASEGDEMKYDTNHDLPKISGEFRNAAHCEPRARQSQFLFGPIYWVKIRF
jgi:hypothetical protein